MIPIPWLTIGRKLLPFLVGAILLIAVYAWHRSAVNEAYKLGVGDTEDRWEAQSLKEVDEARAAVEVARADAEKEKAIANMERGKREEQERAYQVAREEERNALIHDLESRYRKALVEDASCAAWSKQLVACPLR